MHIFLFEINPNAVSDQKRNYTVAEDQNLTVKSEL